MGELYNRCRSDGVRGARESSGTVLAPGWKIFFFAAQLACEIYKACVGQDCALPSGITRIARQGIVIEKPA